MNAEGRQHAHWEAPRRTTPLVIQPMRVTGWIPKLSFPKSILFLLNVDASPAIFVLALYKSNLYGLGT